MPMIEFTKPWRNFKAGQRIGVVAEIANKWVQGNLARLVSDGDGQPIDEQSAEPEAKPRKSARPMTKPAAPDAVKTDTLTRSKPITDSKA